MNDKINFLSSTFCLCIMLTAAVCGGKAYGQKKKFETKYSTFTVNAKGYVVSILDKRSGREYCPKDLPSALLTLVTREKQILPVSAEFNPGDIVLRYPNGAVARIDVQLRPQYLRLQLLSLDNAPDVDNIVWGPYKTTISKKIGEIISVVRDDRFAIGMLALDDNTTSGPPTDGDFGVTYYYIHSPDPLKYPLPPHLKEGQTFKIGGDGRNDIAFYSQPEEYYRMNYGNGAVLEPAFGSSICLHSRNRRKEQMIRFPVLPDNLDGGYNSARYQLVLPADVGFDGSSIALYACPDSLGLKTIERIVLDEGLPHPEVDGKWIKDPASFRPDLAWSGPHDSLAAYMSRLGVKNVQDEGWGEYYPNFENKWGHNRISFTGGRSVTLPQYGAQLKAEGIRYGLHTLCEFLQPGNNSHVAPVPSDSLAIMQRTRIAAALSVTDTVITLEDTCYLNEFGGWEGNHTNVLKIGKELIEYESVTTTRPYTLKNVKRGLYGTVRGDYAAGTVIVKLQPNCYRGFAPDLRLQDSYGDFYGRWLVDGGMDYIDFDGLESCMYQGHGQYSFKRFFRRLFDSYEKAGGKYLRVMGSCIFEGNWHYMSVCNVGGGNHMFDPVLNKWGIEGKDMRYVFESNYFPSTFGIISYTSDWSLYDMENLQAKSIGWDATYMLGLSQRAAEASGLKDAAFSAFRTWEHAREAGVFKARHKEKLKDLAKKFHLEQTAPGIFVLYTLHEERRAEVPYQLDFYSMPLRKAGAAALFEWSVRVRTGKDEYAEGLRLRMPGGQTVPVEVRLTDGQYIIYNDGILYLADRHRKPLRQIVKIDPIAMEGKDPAIGVAALGNGSDKIKLEIVAVQMEEKEKIGQ
ncbi:hypothetical protein [Chitinophaga sp. 22620]|uniref:hypothetical protein n=1 Tax=Chitinophaga sp. 22620 TaxID=3453952 RepID=UPI003F858D63